MQIAPKVNLLKSLRGDRIKYVSLFGEAADNSFDANARNISIDVGGRQIRFRDDGIGITRDRLESFFSLGDHGAMSSTQLGRFGVGIKSQAINAADVIDVKTTSVEGTFTANVNWKHVLASGKWEIADPARLPTAVGAPTGTTLTLSQLRQAPSFSPEKASEELAMRFYPAIADGRSIALNGQRVPLLSDPAMTDVIERSLILSEGRGAVLKAGVLTDPSKLNRVHVSFRHRVIMPASTIGCGEYGGLTKMFARLQLTGSWHLGKFKDDLTDESEVDELENAVFEVIRPILEKCEASSYELRIAELSAAINNRLPAGNRRPDRKGNKLKPGEKRGRQGIVDEKESSSEGPARSNRSPYHSLIVDFDNIAEEQGIGAYQHGGKYPRVILAKDHTAIADLIEHRDTKFVEQALYIIALMLFEHGRRVHDPQSQFDFDFGKNVASLISLQHMNVKEKKTS